MSAVIRLVPTRPVLRYHGGKWRLAPHVIPHFPAHRTYVEPFGGAASVLIRKARSYAEIYNDLDGEIVALLRVLRNRRQARELARQCRLTPYSREEFEASYAPSDDPVEQARRTLVRSWMAHGSSGLRKHRTGFRIGSGREGSSPAGDWRGFPAAIPAIAERLQGVFIEKRPAARIIRKFDRADTLFYVDPPYPFDTRSQKRIGNDLYHGYRHELTDAGHEELLHQLVGLAGMVVMSTYPNAAYDAALAGWTRIEISAQADRGEARTEVLFLNPATTAALAREDARPVQLDIETFAMSAPQRRSYPALAGASRLTVAT